jgi:hypothetical protein
MRWTAAVVTTLLVSGFALSSTALAEDRATVEVIAPGFAGVALFIDDQKQGELPMTVSLEEGTHRYMIRTPAGEELVIVAKVAVEGELALAARLEGLVGAGLEGASLRISALDPGLSLRVVVGDQSMGRTPVNIPLLGQEGPLGLFADSGELLHVEPLKVGQHDVAPAAPLDPTISGKVTLYCEALKGAYVVLDGEPAGTIPLSVNLAQGHHQFFIEPLNGEPFTIERDIEFAAPGMGITIMFEPPR